MKILFITPTHVTDRVNGADMYDHLLCKELITRGHDCTIAAQRTTEPFTFEGVPVAPYRCITKLIREADIVSARPQHYVRLPLKGKNTFVVQHNMIKEPQLKVAKVVYVADHLKALHGYPLPSFVLTPINRYKGVNGILGGKKIALVNCNRNKGGSELIQLAAMMPHRQFVGISGYGQQIKSNAPNIEYREANMHLPRVLHDVDTVVSFSKSEGYPLLCMEAQSLGRHFIGSDIPAHREVGCSAYFRNLDELETMLSAEGYYLPLVSNRPEPDVDGFIDFISR